MPPIIKEEHTWTPGASAVTKDFPLAKRSIAAIILQMDMLGNSGAATIANAKTQLGTYIYIKDGGEKVTPEWSLTELYEYYKAFFGRIPPFQDGTAANDKLALLQVIIPFGRPQVLSHSSLLPSIIDPYVGFKPKNTPYLHVEVPADGNSIDTRHLKVVVVYFDKPPKFNKKWTDWSTQTVSTTGLTDWTIGDKGAWLEAFLFATSEYNATLASDAPSILDIQIERDSKAVLFEGAVPNILGALLDSDVLTDDQYLYMALSQAPFDNFANCVRLIKETKFRILGGVADDVKAAFSVLT